MVLLLMIQSRVIVDDEWRDTTMMESPPMSSYVVCFLISDFAHQSSLLDNDIPVRMILYLFAMLTCLQCSDNLHLRITFASVEIAEYTRSVNDHITTIIGLKKLDIFLSSSFDYFLIFLCTKCRFSASFTFN